MVVKELSRVVRDILNISISLYIKLFYKNIFNYENIIYKKIILYIGVHLEHLEQNVINICHIKNNFVQDVLKHLEHILNKIKQTIASTGYITKYILNSILNKEVLA